MATEARDKEIVEFEVLPDEIDGWDVKKRDEEQSLSNHATRESAERAARLRGDREEADEVRVTVRDDDVHHIDDQDRGVRPAFIYLLGLLVLVMILVVVISLIGSLTGFGA